MFWFFKKKKKISELTFPIDAETALQYADPEALREFLRAKEEMEKEAEESGCKKLQEYLNNDIAAFRKDASPELVKSFNDQTSELAIKLYNGEIDGHEFQSEMHHLIKLEMDIPCYVFK